MEEMRTAPRDGDREEKMRREVREFVQAYPDVKPADIDAAVWQAVGRGETLTAAYRTRQAQRLQEENDRLRRQLEAEEQNREKTGGPAWAPSAPAARSGGTTPFWTRF